MNYYEHHIRDYDAATAHLTWDQDMAYSRLLRWYYRKEQPLPADIAEVCRQLRAVSKPQREAVEAVLKEFFVLREDGWHQDTCDEAIAVFKAGEPEREAKKKNEDTRLARHRAERAELFGIINGAGQHMAWNCPIAELRATAERIKTGPATPPATPTVLNETLPATSPAMGTATPATATQTPDTKHQTPDKKNTPQPPKGGGGCKRFEEFWTAWPKGERKQDKVKCAERWRRGVLDEVADAILADIEVKRGTEKWREGFIEAPLVYLNGRRWEDGAEAAQPQQESFV